MAAIPTVENGGGSMFDQPGRLIEGELPSSIDLARGCRFASRCPFRFARCDEVEPELKTAGAAHAVACHLYD
jgi:oligopeptide/dipeptide ABC transporter ATP-binding protein